MTQLSNRSVHIVVLLEMSFIKWKLLTFTISTGWNAMHYYYSSLIAYWPEQSSCNSPICFLIKSIKTGKGFYWARFWVQMLFSPQSMLIISIQSQTCRINCQQGNLSQCLPDLHFVNAFIESSFQHITLILVHFFYLLFWQFVSAVKR